MCRTRCVLALVALCVGLAQSWDIAATHADLLEFYTNSIKTESISFDSKNLTALVYADVLNMMFFVDKQSGNDAICGYDILTMEKKCFTARNWRNIHGLAFDPVTEKLFFSDTRERSINWISVKRGLVDNIYGNLLTRTGDGIPTDIAVDSCRGYVYWINTNLTPPAIERARFDGSEREVIITSLSIDSANVKMEPHSLVIDQKTQKMFWIEPITRLKYSIFYADLNGNNKQQLNTIEFNDPAALVYPPSTNTLSVSKTKLYWVDWCSNCDILVWEIPKSIMTPWISSYGNFTLHTIGITVSIAANYKIEEKLPEIQNCDRLKSLVRNNCDRPFCVHGTQVNGQSLCECTPGYIGERCDMSVCHNYCMQGDCSFNDAGLPQCRCNAGYSGNRCDVYACHGYCLNNGVCSLDEAEKPFCQCVGNHAGSRCEGVENVSCTNKNQY